MISTNQSQLAPEASSAFWRISGLDFDREGRKSTLRELLEIGGFFPLSSIEDRLPFSASILRKWAKSHKGESIEFIVPFKAEADGRAVITLIHLNRLDEYLSTKVQEIEALEV
jgi:hypothetical protein